MIEARGLVKRYGPTTAVDNLSFDVRPGTVTGFLGPNGAGKSTTMRMILGLDRPDAGQVKINGRSYHDMPWPDRRLIRGLLGPSSMAERVSELERTRTLAVEDAAAALRRVERDLHDGAQMRLAALAMNLGMAREKLGDDDEPDSASYDTATVRELIDAAHRNAADALADLRDLARGIHPPVLDSGLASALASLAASSAIPASVTAGIDPRPAPAIETIAYFCAAELIANATKHSYANQIKINIFTERSGLLRLEVSDDGIGGADAVRGSGLAGLTQRVSTVDGRIHVSSPPGGPTTITVILPLRA